MKNDEEKKTNTIVYIYIYISKKDTCGVRFSAYTPSRGTQEVSFIVLTTHSPSFEQKRKNINSNTYLNESINQICHHLLTIMTKIELKIMIV
jgi:hypothetical protein